MACELEIPFKNIIYPGVKDLDDKDFTLCASSLSCYKIYHKVFEKYLSKEHKATFNPQASHPEMISMSFDNCDFKPADNNLIQKVRFEVRRNYTGIPFGPGSTRESRALVLDIVEDLCRSYMGNFEGTLYKLEELTEDERKELEEFGIE